MSTFSHASIIPLIGGMAIGSENAYNAPPDGFMTFEPFLNNEIHLLNWYKHRGIDIPYYVLDRNEHPNRHYTVVESCCPCAGLSFLSSGYGEHNEANKWMPLAADYVLGTVRPEVYWGENAPHLAGKVGLPVVKKLLDLADKYGYSMSLYRTKSLLHGVPQVRERAFYFFWKGDHVPILNYYNRPYTRIEDLILGITSNFQQEVINPKIPSRDDPYYRYLLEEVYGGITHREFFDKITHDHITTGFLDVKSEIEARGHDHSMMSAWMNKNGYPREVKKCDRAHKKLEDGFNIMRRGTMIPKNYIGAFVSHYPNMLTHPHEDRYITYREAMTIMGLPSDFELLNPKKSVNHICQNVPVQTAEDMATEVREYLNGNRTNMVKARLMLQQNHSKTYKILESREKHATLEGLFD